MAAGAEQEARRHGFYLIIGSVEDGSPDDEEAYLRLMQQRRIDGLIVARPRLRPGSRRFLADMASSIPTVAIASRVEALRLNSVDIDNLGGGRIAAQHLLENGHTAIAMITGPPDWPSAQARTRGAQDALREAGKQRDLVVEASPDWGVEGGRAATSRLLKSGRRFTAIFAQSDLLALGAIAELQARGLAVPREVSIVGYDDIPVAQYMTPALTTVRQPMPDVGARAVRLLLEELGASGNGSSLRRKHLLVDVSLVVRDSVVGPIDSPLRRRGSGSRVRRSPGHT